MTNILFDVTEQEINQHLESQFEESIMEFLEKGNVQIQYILWVKLMLKYQKLVSIQGFSIKRRVLFFISCAVDHFKRFVSAKIRLR